MARKFNDNVDLAGNQITQVVLENLAADPGSLLGDGRIWYDTVLDVVRVRANGATVSLAAGSSYTDEQAQDAIGAAFAAGAQTGVTVTYDDVGNALSIQRSALTGDVTAPAGSNATTIASSVVTNAKLANMAANSIKGNNTGSPAVALDLTTAQVKTLLAIVPGDVTGFDTQVRTSTLNQMTAPTADLSINSHKLTNLLDPTSAQDAATKAYVDALSVGLDPKGSVRFASTANVSGTYTAAGGTSARGQLTAMPNAAIDGVTPVAGNRVLLKDQTAGAQNGIWVITTLGTGANGVWDRAVDFDQDAEVTAGAHVFVEEGTVNADTGWVLATDNPITIGGASGTSLAWVQFSGAGEITAGAALTKTGNTLDVAVSTGIEISADALRLAAAGAGTGLTGGAGAALAVNPGTSLELSGNTVRLAAAAAGAGLTGGGASALSVDHTVVPKLFVGAITGGATSEVVTHNLGTRDVMVLVYLAAGTFAEEEFSVEHTSTNTVTIRSAITIPTTTYRVVVFG